MSNTATRVLVAVIAIPVILLLAYLGGWFWFAFMLSVLVVSLMEFRALVLAKGMEPQPALMIAGAGGLLVVFINERLRSDLGLLFDGRIATALQWQAFIWILLVLLVVAMLVELFRNRGSAVFNLSALFFGVLYIGLGAGTTVGIREIFSIGEFPVGEWFGTVELSMEQASQLHRWGGFTTMALLATIWICDTAAYFGGRAMGKKKLFVRVSPNKTWAGTLWGLAGAVAAMVAAKFLFLDYLALSHAVVIGVFVGTIGQLGDLAESLLKRDAAVKDSSTLLPGHGGVLDRFDSLLFVSPVVFLYLDFVVFA